MSGAGNRGDTHSDGLLFTPFDLAGLRLANRMVMAPMSRHRADALNRPHALAATYYRQRASAGLLIAEGTQTSLFAKGFPGVPGIFTPGQISEWRKTTAAVHEAGGRIFLQLWHCGRISHRLCQPNGQLPVAPSAIRATAVAVLDDGSRVETDTPRALETRELPALTEEFATAAANAVEAEFDGVELHAANGYLLNQFLCDGSNQRCDRYGGSITNRIRFVVETLEAVTARIGAHRTGIRLSPVTTYMDTHDSDPPALYTALIEQLSRLQLGYVHAVEGLAGVSRDWLDFDFTAARRLFDGPWIANNMFDRTLAQTALAEGRSDLVSFGRPFVANPDLVERYRLIAPLNDIDPAHLYGGGEQGYTDYPALDPVMPTTFDTRHAQ
jgi:N-ethylmaleimide reductase